LVQLDHLGEWTERRIAAAAYLSAHLHGVGLPSTLPNYRHVYHQYTVRVPQVRDALAKRLSETGVGTGVHYPIPVHLQPLYRELGYDDQLPCAEQASRDVLSLPIHPALSQGDLDIIAEYVSSMSAQLAPRPLLAGSLT
jgi:dTDP-4-amino-4,6-dideoxygalactose transaminase